MTDDGFIATDLDEMAQRFRDIVREHNEREESIGRSFREAERRALDWDFEIPEFNFPDAEPGA